MTKITSSSSWRALALAVLATTAGAVAAPSAWADAPLTLCVHQSSACPAGATDKGSDLQGALDAAAVHPAPADSPNVIDVEAGTYTATANPGFTYQSTNPLRIVGAGSHSTTLTAADSVVDTLDLESTPTSQSIAVSGLTITNLAYNGHAFTLFGGTAEDLVVATQQDGVAPVQLRGATLSHSAVYAQNAFIGVWGQPGPGGPIELDDDTINSGTEGVVTYGPATIHRVTVTSQWGVLAEDARVSIDDSLIEAQHGISLVGLNQSASMAGINDTLIGTQGAAEGVRAASYNGHAADAQIVNSIVYAFPTSFATLDDTAGDHSTVEASTDSYNGTSSGSGIARTTPIGDDPGFVAPLEGNYHLGSWSGLIDTSATQSLGTVSSTTDRDGNPRAVAVNHSATPVDLGAYEYQSPAPAGGNPGSGGGNPGPGTPGPGTGGGTPGTNQSPSTGTPGTGTPSNGSGPTASTHPRRTVRLTALGHAVVTGKRIALRLSCTGTAPCSPITLIATALHRHHRVTVGSLTTRLAAGRTATLAVTLNRAGRSLRASMRHRAVTITVTVGNGTRRLAVETAHVRLT
jgi:hypothetical protein